MCTRASECVRARARAGAPGCEGVPAGSRSARTQKSRARWKVCVCGNRLAAAAHLNSSEPCTQPVIASFPSSAMVLSTVAFPAPPAFRCDGFAAGAAEGGEQRSGGALIGRAPRPAQSKHVNPPPRPESHLAGIRASRGGAVLKHAIGSPGPRANHRLRHADPPSAATAPPPAHRQPPSR